MLWLFSEYKRPWSPTGQPEMDLCDAKCRLNLSCGESIVQVNTYIEDCIAQKDPLIKVLRLMCMQSVCNHGLKQKVLDFYKREILQVLGENDIFPCAGVAWIIIPTWM